MTTTQQDTNMLADMHGTPYFEFLGRRLNDVLANMIYCSDADALRNQQGKAQMLSELITDIQIAEDKRANRPGSPYIENRNRF